MKVHYCDKCGEPLKAPIELKLINTMSRADVCTYELCKRCAFQLKEEMEQHVKRIFEDKVGNNED